MNYWQAAIEDVGPGGVQGIELKGLVDPMHPSAVYAMPEVVGGVGLTEEQCRNQSTTEK